MNTIGSGRGPHSEINVTPLVDVVLVLLIIFIVIAPLTMYGYDVDIPGEADGIAPAEAEPEQIVLGIDLQGCPLAVSPDEDGLAADCRVRLDGELLPARDLAVRVGELFSARAPSERVLFLAAHEELNYEGVMRIIDRAKSGVPELRIGVVTEAPVE